MWRKAGLGRAGTTATAMLDQFVAWMAIQGFLAPAGTKR